MKITKILVALTFLFSVVSANAGEMTVTGSMKATYQSETDGVTGNPLGMDTELTFAGSTELDNGVTVSYMQDTADQGVFGDQMLTFGNVFGFATIYLGNDADPMDSIDDITPSAFEEANGAGSGTYVDIGSNKTNSNGLGVQLNVPFLGALNAMYYPQNDGVENADGAASGTGTVGSAYSATLTTPLSGLPAVGSALEGATLTTGIAEREVSTSAKTSDLLELTAALNYAYGPVSFGYQKTWSDRGQTIADAGETTYKDDIVGIAYKVNDSLSLSWNRYTSLKSDDAADAVEQETDAINIGYTIGGMTIGFIDASTDNAAYTLNSKDDTRRLQLSVAF